MNDIHSAFIHLRESLQAHPLTSSWLTIAVVAELVLFVRSLL